MTGEPAPIDERTWHVDFSGRTVLVVGGAGYVGSVLVTEPTGSQYCRGDIVRTFDRSSRIPGPACILGDFVPYRRP